MNESERLEILELLAAQKISAKEAADMLRQLDNTGTVETHSAPKEPLKAQEEPPFKPEITILDEEETGMKMDAWSDIATKDTGAEKAHWLRIRVRDMGSQRNKVTVNLPLWLVSFGVGAAQRFGADMGGVDPDMIREMLKEGRRGILVDVQDEEDGEHVQIYLD